MGASLILMMKKKMMMMMMVIVYSEGGPAQFPLASYPLNVA